MDEQINCLSFINMPTRSLTSVSMQEVLKAVKRHKQDDTQKNTDVWVYVTEILWKHLQEGLTKFDDQLLCATSFYTVLSLTDKEDTYVKKIEDIINQEGNNHKNHNFKENSNTMFAVSLMYGVFQSSFLTGNLNNSNRLENLMKAIFKLLHLMAYKYSKYTFIVFKVLHSLKKICGTPLQEVLFDQSNKIKLLNLVNHNWENPITGVRELNKGIFQIIIVVLDQEMYNTVLKEINNFHWNKAKYLMLAEIISQNDTDLASNVGKYSWTDGLISSLYKPGLVSAGADMYFAFLKKIKSEEEWCFFFKKLIFDLLCSASTKGVENFTNYWCLTTFKSYPGLINLLLKELENLSDSETKLYSSLSVMKQANKLGFLTKNWNTGIQTYIENTILNGIIHANYQIRMMAIDIVCLTQSKAMPTREEYELVLDFIRSNINSDCTVLRLGMIKSINNFLMHIHVCYLNYFKENDDKENLKHFCCTFQELIEYNLNINGNYQRKITCIKLTTIFLSALKVVTRKWQKQTRHTDTNMIKMLDNEGCWFMFQDKIVASLIALMKDASEDIRTHVGQMLLQHYSKELAKPKLLNTLIDGALKSMSSKFFFEISCGQSMFKLIINILIQENCSQTKFKKVNEVFNFALEELNNEYQLKRGIVESIIKGKQLNSYMSILHAVLEVCHETNELLTLPCQSINTLLNVLEGVSNQFLWEQETSTSSDFSKINDMVQDIIDNAGFVQKNDDATQISGLHQIVLNSLWLNIKASCELSSLLVTQQKDDAGIEIAEKALQIICHILETCRHKGAIEAAGTALGQSIQHLTSLPEETEISKLPFSFLKTKIHELISETSKMASVTRRGAGLSILVHRVVSSDVQRGKPLFHYFMETIIETCTKINDIPSDVNAEEIIDNEKDLPKAIYIHFLTKIVTDSSLSSEMMFYSSELAELAFGNLTSPYWQIRNAALQLYGALLQKLIGQKKSCGIDDETGATVGCDELRTHSPKLWDYIEVYLMNKNNDKIAEMQWHSNLVPILNMLASLTRRYNFSFNTNLKEKDSHHNLLKNLMSFLGSPIHTVRRLSAKSIFNMCNLDEICKYIFEQNVMSENFLHGSLMLVATYHKLLGLNEKYSELKSKYMAILIVKEHSYIVKEIYEEIFDDGNATLNDVQQTLGHLHVNAHVPGVFIWANTRIKMYLNSADWNKTPELLKTILKQNNRETYLKMLLDKIDEESNIPEKIKLDLINYLLLYKDKFNSSVLWKILYKLSIDIDEIQLKSSDYSDMLNYLSSKSEVSYKLRYMIPFAAKILSDSEKLSEIETISKIIEGITDPENADLDMRFIAATANNVLSTKITKLPESVKISILKCTLILLQDEDEEVRMLSVPFYSKAISSDKSFQPYICLCKIMEQSFLRIFLNESAISKLQQELLKYTSRITSKTVDEYNPFANNCSNIYFEANIFRELIKNL